MTEIAAKNGTGKNETLALWHQFLDEGYDYVRPKRGDFFTGTVLEVHPELVVVDIGAKRDGFVPSSDLKRLDDEVADDLDVGDEVPVLVERAYDRDGDLILSVSRGRELEDWQNAQKLLEQDEIIEIQIDGHNRGGVTATFGQIRGFIPASHLIGIPVSYTHLRAHET